jgi:hypothetical protein
LAGDEPGTLLASIVDSVRAEHFVQLFDSNGSVAAAVSTFIQEGLADGDAVLIVTTKDRWDLVSLQLAGRGVSVQTQMEAGRLVHIEASHLLRQFMHPWGPAPALFEAAVVPVVRALAGTANRLRIYGDMVDLLAGSGDYASAHRLETMWNELVAVVPCQLFCGYSASHFDSSHHAEALRIICRCHSRVRSSRDDTLSSRLLDASGAAARA